MELELGLKLKRVAKNRAGPVFVSSETDEMFILTAHLRGYRKDSIKIEINEDGTCIAISVEKQVLETAIVGWQVQKKVAEIKRFRKGFKIPDGVILEELRAEFNDDESLLTITMPKKVMGIRGCGIKEVKEEENIARQSPEALQTVDGGTSREGASQQREDQDLEGTCNAESDIADKRSPEVCNIDSSDESKQIVGKATLPKPVEGEDDHHKENAEGRKHDQLTQNADSRIASSGDETPYLENQEMPQQEISNDIQKTRESHWDRGDSSCSKQHPDHHRHKDDQLDGEGDGGTAKEAQEGEFRKREEADVPERRSIICAPIVAGSAILVSLVVFCFQFLRHKGSPGKSQN